LKRQAVDGEAIPGGFGRQDYKKRKSKNAYMDGDACVIENTAIRT
jgi:hypothetical protein